MIYDFVVAHCLTPASQKTGHQVLSPHSSRAAQLLHSQLLADVHGNISRCLEENYE